jgi:nucleoside-diphosphate-sugar epimerase
VTTVALTGATGFIGHVLLEHLLSQGLRIKALYRPTSTPPSTSTKSVQWHSGNLNDQASLRALVCGVDAIIHCAGAVRGSTFEHFKKVNAEGVTHILQVAIEQKVKRFILMSSLAAREPALSDYAASKKLGEDILKQYTEKISWSILRPPAVYGPGDREMLPLLKLVKRGIIPIIGDKNGRFSLLYVDDLAEATSSLLKSSQSGKGQCFELHDGHPDGYTWHQIAEIATQLNGIKPRCFSIPRQLIEVIGSVNSSLSRLVGYQPILTSGKVREIFHPDWVCDNTAISDAVDWQPKVQLLEGMKRLFDMGA